MADTLDRSQVVIGPGIITFKGQTFYTEGDFNLEFDGGSMAERKTSILGTTDKAPLDRIAKISFTPTQITAGALPVMFPFGAMKIGDPLFTGTDQTVVIQTTAGKAITLQSGAVTKAPELNLNTKDSLLGSMEITCLGKNNTSWATAASFIDVATVAWVDPATYDLATILNQLFTASWASSGAWSAFTSEAGFKIQMDVKLQPMSNDSVGTYNFILDDLSVRCKCVPFPGGASPIAEAELISAIGWQGTGAARGKSASQFASTHDLVIAGSETAAQTPHRKLTVTITKAALLSAGMQFGNTKLRNGEFGFEATRSISAGTVNPLYSIALT
jgi:hypothetical protein